MRDFFNGWRRKVGCVALVMALLVAVVWIRSMVIGDAVWVRVGDRLHQFNTANGTLYWWGYQDTPHPDLSRYYHYPFFQPVEGMKVLYAENLYRRELKSSRFAEWIIPHWSIAVPLVLLSTYLLLWKPRKRTGQDHA